MVMWRRRKGLKGGVRSPERIFNKFSLLKNSRKFCGFDVLGILIGFDIEIKEHLWRFLPVFIFFIIIQYWIKQVKKYRWVLPTDV